jgi:MFS family permease
MDIEPARIVRSGSQKEGSPASRTASEPSVVPITFPEGGVESWLVVFASFCAMISVFGLINTAAVFESWFSTHQLAKYTPSEIGWIFSLYLFFVFFVGIQVGPYFDHHGPRYLVAAGSVLIVASLMLLGFCEEYYQILLCYSVLGGLGGALLNTPAYGCIAHFFSRRRGLATGIATTSGGVGGIVFPVLLQKLLPQLGFAWSTRILGFILLALAVPANLWLRTRLPVSGHLQSVWPDFTIFRDRAYAVASAGIFFMEWGIFVPLTFIVSYAVAHGQDAGDSYTLLSLLNAGSVLGRFLPGLVADRMGRFNVIILTIALSAAMVLGLWLPAGSSPSMLAAFSVMFGFASGSNLGLVAVCLGQLCEPSEYGRFLSTAMMVASFGTLSSVPIAGALLGVGSGEDGWMAVIIFSGTAYVIALACYITARVLAVGWKVTTVF